MTEVSQNIRYVGTSVYGVRMPIIREGADIANIILSLKHLNQNISQSHLTIKIS